MAIDLLLYVCLGLGILLGRLLPHPGDWVGRATVATIVALVASLGALLGPVPWGTLAGAVPVALLFTSTILLLTVLIEQVWVRSKGPRPGGEGTDGPKGPARQLWLPPVLVGALFAGLGAGHLVALPASGLITGALYLLLFLVGFDLKFHWASLRTIGIPTASAFLGAAAAASLISLVLGIPGRVALAIAFGFGWYSLAGPVLAQAVGPAAGLLGFLVNFLRENVPMLSAPALGRRVRGEGLAAMGGATSMDTT
ncbi:MAG TPA: LysO family transporter, partial [Thermoplasmata archaeon]|nr:LysO family transporter [Thermoplasmata archaeon]